MMMVSESQPQMQPGTNVDIFKTRLFKDATIYFESRPEEQRAQVGLVIGRKTMLE